jgi:hypothetical protein
MYELKKIGGHAQSPCVATAYIHIKSSEQHFVCKFVDQSQKKWWGSSSLTGPFVPLNSTNHRISILKYNQRARGGVILRNNPFHELAKGYYISIHNLWQ